MSEAIRIVCAECGMAAPVENPDVIADMIKNGWICPCGFNNVGTDPVKVAKPKAKKKAPAKKK